MFTALLIFFVLGVLLAVVALAFGIVCRSQRVKGALQSNPKKQHRYRMTYKTLCISLVICVVGLVVCAASVLLDKSELPAAISETHSEAQLRRDIGEMLLVGFDGYTVAQSSHIKSDIVDHHVGSVILFRYNVRKGKNERNIKSPAQVKRLCAELQRLAGGTLLIGIDQEGGKVQRLTRADGFPFIAAPQYCAQQGMDTVAYYASLTAQTLASLGINYDFAPLADVDVNPNCPVIGKLGRSFSSKPEVVASCCATWVDSLLAYHVGASLKHFPGHGSATGDTHLGLVDVTDTWQECELEPYRTLISQGKAPMVMTAHVINRRYDSLPASLSYKVTTELLRNRLHFDGVVVTDDLAMGAIIKQYEYDTVVRMAIEAGADLLCLSNNNPKGENPELIPHTVEVILDLVRDGIITEERIHQSAERVRKLKSTLQLQ